MPLAMITGANRGLGYEYTRQLLERGWDVIACARRTPSSEFDALAAEFGERLRVSELDVTNHAAIDALAEQLQGEPIDLLINNAGTTGPKGTPECMEYQGLANMDYAIWRDIFEVNVLGLFKVATAFKPNLAASDRGLLVNLSSDLGSCAQNTQGNMHSYRASKAAVNILNKGMSIEWPDVICIAMAPGWCRTELGGEAAEIAPDESVAAQLDTFDKLAAGDSGRFINRFGDAVPY
ncbi:MAG: SDR family oxidoreductase [Gammaproteobacteria bacterium]|nr:SDR family oxidoreductase [Gammaproteobacteria bacterium]NND36671.1 SDR family oxidoreductase [Gammaproteobacteria bacterium]